MYSNIIKKANQSSDTQLIRNLNTALATSLAEKGATKYSTAHDAFAAVDEAGYNIGRIVSKSGYNIAYEMDNGRFVLLDTEGDGKVLYPVDVNTNEEYKATKAGKANYFVVKSADAGKPYEASGYSVYAGPNFKAKTVTLKGVGFDAGDNTEITVVNYNGIQNTVNDVVIRTNGGELVVNGYVDPSDPTKGDKVAHYGFAEKVDVQAVAMASYDEYGTVPFMTVANGHVAIDSEGFVGGVHLTKKTDTSFDEIVITVASEDMPKFSRDPVTCATGTEIKVCTVEVENTKDVIYLTNNGIYEQIKLAPVTGTTEGAKAYIDGDPEDSKINTAADQIANNISGTKGVDYTVAEDTRALTIVNEENAKVEDSGTEPWIAQYKSELVGSGTKNDPFEIYDYATFQKVTNFYDIGYTYFKVKDGVKYIDCSNWVSVSLYGSLNGNDCKLINLDKPLFNDFKYGNGEEQVVYSFDIDCNVVSTNVYGGGVICDDCDANLTLRDINIDGYVEVGANGALFVDYGSFDGEQKVIKFYNCGGSATFVNRSNCAGIYIGHPGTKSTFEAYDCNYTGTAYVTTNGSVCLNAYYTTSGKEKFAYYVNGVNLTENGIDSKTGKMTYKNLYYTESVKYLATESIDATGYEIGSIFEITAANSSYAVAQYNIGCNGNQITYFGGSYTGVYMTEKLSKEDSKYKTSNIKKYNVDCNATGITETGLVGDTFHIVNQAYGTQIDCYDVKIIEYDNNNNIVKITTFKLQ